MITREEAIDYNKNLKMYMRISDKQNPCKFLEENYIALDMAIEALKEMPVEEYRQRLMDVFHRTDHDELLAYVVMPKDEEFKSLEDIIHRFKFEPRLRGEWKPLGEPDDLGIHSWYICSRCGFRTTWHMVDIFHFCPNCGSDNRPKIHGCCFVDETCKNNPCKDCGLREGEKNESDHL